MPFKFEKLLVWQKATELSSTIFQITREFPKEELYILTSQMRRAADSVSLNIAEGSTGQTVPEFKRFLKIALRSDLEVVSCIFLARKRGLIGEDIFNNGYKICEEILAMLNGLIKSLK